MDFDLIIVGAGLAGASLAAALQSSRYRIAVIEGRAPAPAQEGWDTRIYAISPANVAFLDGIGVWGQLDPSRLAPVFDMEVYGDRHGRLDFSAYAAGVAELAWIAESGHVQRELWERIKRQPNVKLFCPSSPESLVLGPDSAQLLLAGGERISARLVVAADGVDSWVRGRAGIAAAIRAYGELGVVANFACERPHGNAAFQWFREDGVLAYLPLPGDAISIVWSAPEPRARELLDLPAEALGETVAEAGQRRLGRLALLNRPAGFPLRLMRPARTVGHRVALIGDAAHAIHPLSGHGINLGFQDAKVLSQVLGSLPEYRDCGAEQELRPYERNRAEEALALQTATHALNRLFRPSLAPLAWLRNLGLNLTNHLPAVRDMLVRYALG